jgi:hypothetical protein
MPQTLTLSPFTLRSPRIPSIGGGFWTSCMGVAIPLERGPPMGLRRKWGSRPPRIEWRFLPITFANQMGATE